MQNAKCKIIVFQVFRFTVCPSANTAMLGKRQIKMQIYGDKDGEKTEPQETVTLYESLGKLTVLNFWATWCTPCVAEVPYFEMIQNNFADDVKVFASCHNHSNFSDAEYSPETLARMAWNMGHGGIILTDHDTAKGYPFITCSFPTRNKMLT